MICPFVFGKAAMHSSVSASHPAFYHDSLINGLDGFYE